MGSIAVEGFANNVLCATSSHFCSAEKQFRFPLELGNQRPPSSQWTVTGSGAAILSKNGTGPYITHVTPGKIVDMGITGVDLINESEANVKELVDLSFGQTKLVLASPEDSNINSIDDLTSDMVVATEFPTLTKKYLEKHDLTSKIITLSGSTEIAPLIGIADLITDLTSTGTTLKMNHLKIVDVILESTIKLITNDNSFENKKELVEAVSTSIKGVIEAERKKLVMMNVKKENLDNVKKVMPAMTGPTISEVLSKEETVAVQAVIDEDVVFELVNDLRNAGAKDILVVPIERII